MRTQTKHQLLAALLGVAFTAQLHAQTTAFTYQGRLTEGGSPASGIYDLRFTIYDAASSGSVVGDPLTNSAVAVSNGLFTTTLDFGAGVFNGNERWLQIDVQTNGGGAFSALAPRQPITSSPYAIQSLNATTATNAAGLTGNISDAQLSTNVSKLGSSIDSSEIADGTIVTNDFSSSVLNGTFWKLGGNTGISPGTQFLGTTENQPLQLAFQAPSRSGGRIKMLPTHSHCWILL